MVVSVVRDQCAFMFHTSCSSLSCSFSVPSSMSTSSSSSWLSNRARLLRFDLTGDSPSTDTSKSSGSSSLESRPRLAGVTEPDMIVARLRYGESKRCSSKVHDNARKTRVRRELESGGLRHQERNRSGCGSELGSASGSPSRGNKHRFRRRLFASAIDHDPARKSVRRAWVERAGI